MGFLKKCAFSSGPDSTFNIPTGVSWAYELKAQKANVGYILNSRGKVTPEGTPHI
jgi:hypothetical protein